MWKRFSVSDLLRQSLLLTLRTTARCCSRKLEAPDDGKAGTKSGAGPARNQIRPLHQPLPS